MIQLPKSKIERRLVFSFTLLWALAGAAVNLTAAQSRAPVNEQNWIIEGIVTDSHGKPLEDVQIRAEAREGATAISDDKGRYVLKGSRPGRYAVFAKRDGYARTRFRFLQLMATMRVKLDLKMDREAVLSGRAISREGTPIAGVQISAWVREFRDGRPLFAFRGGTKSDESGHYTIKGLSEDDYYLGGISKQIGIQKYSSSNVKDIKRVGTVYPPIFYPGVYSFEEANPIHLRNSEQREGLDFVFGEVPGFCAIASISFSNPSQQEKAAIILTERTRTWSFIIGGGETQPGQKIEICNLVPGIHYSLAAQVWSEKMEVLGFAERNFEGTRLDAELNQPLDLGVLLVRSGEVVKGKITLEPSQQDGSFPSNVFAVLENMTGLPAYVNETRDVQIQPTGEFLLPNVFPYEHVLRIYNLPVGYYVKQATCDHYDLLKEPWRPSCGIVYVTVALDAATITGQVVDENNLPVDDGDVILVPKSSSAQITVRAIDQGGNFKFSSVIPGAYNIFAITGMPENQSQNPNVIGKYLFHATDINAASKGQQFLTLKILTVE